MSVFIQAAATAQFSGGDTGGLLSSACPESVISVVVFKCHRNFMRINTSQLQKLGTSKHTWLIDK